MRQGTVRVTLARALHHLLGRGGRGDGRRGRRREARRRAPAAARSASAIDLVPDAAPGDVLLCHAGIALEQRGAAVKFVDEFRSAELARGLAAEIASLVEPGETVRIMEVCGGHTHTIYRHGLEDLLPPEVELVHGPGCPVCVIPMGRVDDAIALAERPDVTLATFGDMMRVPGGRGSLLEAKARGADVRMVYSPLDALALARARARPRASSSSRSASRRPRPRRRSRCCAPAPQGTPNFAVFCNHVTIEPPLRAILETPGLRVDAFIGPGHVSTVIGTDAYRFIPEEYGRPIVVSAFEPVDLLQSIAMLLRQRARGPLRGREPVHARRAAARGTRARSPRSTETMELRDDFEWRGLGSIAAERAALRAEFADVGRRGAATRCRARGSRTRRRAAAARC